jgi:hypothetical protein
MDEQLRYSAYQLILDSVQDSGVQENQRLQGVMFKVWFTEQYRLTKLLQVCCLLPSVHKDHNDKAVLEASSN